jgi:alkaline phosphatase
MGRLLCCVVGFWAGLSAVGAWAADPWRDLQTAAVRQGQADFGHWGPDATKYSSWTSHSNRLIPVYTFGIDLKTVKQQSPYRDAERLRELYGEVPSATVNASADYFDQTDVYHLQKAAADAGKKYIVLVVFDGMDWPITQLGAMAKSNTYTREGRGHGLHFLDYDKTITDYGYCVTSPHNDGTACDVDRQLVLNPGGTLRGGYNFRVAGCTPWAASSDPLYPIGEYKTCRHAYTDSSASASSLTAGLKTYNSSVNVDPFGRQVETIAHQLQQRGYSIGIVTSVPISHATPACAYSHNVHRDDYQDLTRDLLGLPSIAHPNQPLPGVDVLIGAGWGENIESDSAQGNNFVPGNRYVTSADVESVRSTNGGKYVVAFREPGTAGQHLLDAAAQRAIKTQQRLFAMFGHSSGHLPFRTADGRFDPTLSVDEDGRPIDAEQYSEADLNENPTLEEMTSAALDVLQSRARPFWLLVESGDVDWAAHKNNIDNAAGAVISGDDAFHVVTEWIEAHDAWDESAVILTSDHGHYFVIDDPQPLLAD